MDEDTAVMARTGEAALRAVGAVCAAVDAVMRGEAANAFCAVRPPGHHAERTKACGFCFFNNVAVAAEYARRAHGITRVAVVDFDVHHGNGALVGEWELESGSGGKRVAWRVVGQRAREQRAERERAESGEGKSVQARGERAGERPQEEVGRGRERDRETERERTGCPPRIRSDCELLTRFVSFSPLPLSAPPHEWVPTTFCEPTLCVNGRYRDAAHV